MSNRLFLLLADTLSYPFQSLLFLLFFLTHFTFHSFLDPFVSFHLIFFSLIFDVTLSNEFVFLLSLS